MHSGEVPVIITEKEFAELDLTNEFGERLGVFVRGRQDDDLLKLSTVRKVSPEGVYIPGRGWNALTPNSFGLPPGETCPGKTKFCEDCYAFRALNNKNVEAMLQSNLELLSSLDSVEVMTEYLSEMVSRFRSHAMRNELDPKDWIFRIHWSGDFYSEDYAKAWAETIKRFPEISFWCYTRSFRPPVDIVPILDGIENLELFLSTDKHNIGDVPPEYDHIRRANSALDEVSAARFMPEDRTSRTCPENLDRIALMQDQEGACVKCRLCLGSTIRSAVDITFVTSGKHNANASRYASEVEEKPIDPESIPRPTFRSSRYITNNVL